LVKTDQIADFTSEIVVYVQTFRV